MLEVRVYCVSAIPALFCSDFSLLSTCVSSALSDFPNAAVTTATRLRRDCNCSTMRLPCFEWELQSVVTAA